MVWWKALITVLIFLVTACSAGQATESPTLPLASVETGELTGEPAAEAVITAPSPSTSSPSLTTRSITATRPANPTAFASATLAVASPTETPLPTVSEEMPETTATVTAMAVEEMTATPSNTSAPPSPTQASLPPPAAQPPPALAGETTFSLSPAPVGAAAAQVYETTLTIPTYDYEPAFIPTQPEDEIYPYPRLDPARVGPPSPRTYRAVVLENGFVSLTILPELGGRIYRWVDKATGRHLLYENPVVKPTSWGYRGWWLAAGGIEWAFPVEEHGLNEWRPWRYSSGNTAYGLGVTVSDVDDRTGMEVGATISLDSGHAYVTIQPWARNNTGQAHSYQLWLNAMVAMGGNHVSGPTQLIIPAGEVTIHSAGDVGVPGSGSPMSWPYYGGRDLSWYSNWNGHIGFFAPAVYAGFTGIYDHAVDQGIVRAYNPGWPAGTKIFGPSTLSPEYWTDDSSNYIELWSGATGSFWSYGTLNPGQSFSWAEQWYPVHDIGGFTFANRQAALRLVDTGGGAEVAVAVSGGVTGKLTLWAGGRIVAEWPGAEGSLTIYPGQAFKGTWTRPAGLEGGLGLRLERQDGTVAAQTGQVP